MVKIYKTPLPIVCILILIVSYIAVTRDFAIEAAFHSQAFWYFDSKGLSNTVCIQYWKYAKGWVVFEYNLSLIATYVLCIFSECSCYLLNIQRHGVSSDASTAMWVRSTYIRSTKKRKWSELFAPPERGFSASPIGDRVHFMVLGQHRSKSTPTCGPDVPSDLLLRPSALSAVHSSRYLPRYLDISVSTWFWNEWSIKISGVLRQLRV